VTDANFAPWTYPNAIRRVAIDGLEPQTLVQSTTTTQSLTTTHVPPTASTTAASTTSLELSFSTTTTAASTASATARYDEDSSNQEDGFDVPTLVAGVVGSLAALGIAGAALYVIHKRRLGRHEAQIAKDYANALFGDEATMGMP